MLGDSKFFPALCTPVNDYERIMSTDFRIQVGNFAVMEPENEDQPYICLNFIEGARQRKPCCEIQDLRLYLFNTSLDFSIYLIIIYYAEIKPWKQGKAINTLDLHGVIRQIISHSTLLPFYLQKLQVPSKQHSPYYWSCVSECHRLYQNHRFLKLSPLQPAASCFKK